MQQFGKGFESFATAQKDMVAQAYLGREVQIDDEGTTIEGLVDSVEKLKMVWCLLLLVVNLMIRKKLHE